MNGQFRKEIGRIVLYGMVAYTFMLTGSLMLSAWCGKDVLGPVREVLSLILGWWLGKASTVVDHQYGTSQSSEDKTKFSERQVERSANNPPAAG